MLRYLAFQVPGWLLVGGGCLAAVQWWEVSPRLAGTVLALYVLKDLVMFPFVRIGYEPHSSGGPAALVGASVVAEDPLTPRGYVRLGGELWRAELRGGGAVAAGRRLRVVELRDLTLWVEPESEGQES